MQASDLRLMRLTLAVVWLVSGVLSLGIYPRQQSMEILAGVNLHGEAATLALYGGALLDILLGTLTLVRPVQMLWRVQAGVILVYSAVITVWLPQYWLHPFGPVLKNLPILLLLWLLRRYGNSTP
ncbi:MAG TPA: DoxX-like family protein [Gallionellaceae bacterium]|nr:DoxX-like family protein [Gallionellaceae bacterium]